MSFLTLLSLSVLFLSAFVFLLLGIEKGLIRSDSHTYLLLNCNVGKVIIQPLEHINNNITIFLDPVLTQ